ncbi:MAG: ABC transporter permease [Nanoarchaeota archaeon]|nr:ABC transporter permease [Nanoarchaeota archaeon]
MLNFFRKRTKAELYRKSKFGVSAKEKRDFEALKRHSNLKQKHLYHFLIKLFNIIIKNYKLLIRSKTSALIFFFGPLLIIFLVGLGFNTSSLNDISIATYSDSYSPLTETLFSNLSSEEYNIAKVGSLEDCISAVKFGSSHVCIVFPPEMVLDNSARNNIEIYVDQSRINLAHLITKRLDAKVDIQSAELSGSLVSQILSSLDNINKETVSGESGVSALDSNINSINQKLDSVADDIDEFNFEYSVFDTTPVTDELDSLRNQFNFSSRFFVDVETSLEELQLQYDQMAGKLEEAKIQSGNVKENVANIGNKITSNKNIINQLNQMLSKIKQNIQNIKITNVESIVSPIKTTIKPLSIKKSYLAYTFPILIVLLIMFVAILMSSTSIVREKKSMAYFRNFITPTFNGLFIIGQYLSDLTIIFLQLVIIFGVGSLFLTDLSWKIYLIGGGMMLIFASIFIFMGMALGYLFNTEESATTSAISVATVFLLFSNAILPLETLSGLFRKIVSFNPLVIGEKIIKWFLLFESDFGIIIKPLIILCIWVIATMIFAIISAYISKKMKR